MCHIRRLQRNRNVSGYHVCHGDWFEDTYCYFFFQAEDGIRDYKVTGVQTCALPILTVLIMQGLPKLQGTHVYQGWLIQNNTPVSIGLLSVQNGVASVDFPGDITNYQDRKSVV